jgi:exodeoxyribonuclease VII small subunit
MSEQKITYKQAFQRIEQIVSEIEGDDPDVDKLTDLVKEGLELLKHCKKHLKSTEEDLNQALQELE